MQVPVKVLLLGDKGVGKTTIFRVGTRDIDGTMGSGGLMQHGTVHMKISDEHTCRAHLLDVNGTTSLRHVVQPFLHQQHGAIVVYDVTSQESFESAERWIIDFKQRQKTKGGIVALVANKVDVSGEHAVSLLEGQTLAMAHGCLFFNFSALNDSDAVDVMFQVFLCELFYSLVPGEEAFVAPAIPCITVDSPPVAVGNSKTPSNSAFSLLKRSASLWSIASSSKASSTLSDPIEIDDPQLNEQKEKQQKLQRKQSYWSLSTATTLFEDSPIIEEETLDQLSLSDKEKGYAWEERKKRPLTMPRVSKKPSIWSLASYQATPAVSSTTTETSEQISSTSSFPTSINGALETISSVSASIVSFLDPHYHNEEDAAKKIPPPPQETMNPFPRKKSVLLSGL